MQTHHPVFEKYQQQRREFVQMIAEQASKPENIDTLIQRNILSILRPLLMDTISSIQQIAALAIGRLANYSEQIAQDIVNNEILPEIILGINSEDPYYKRNCCFVLRSVAIHNESLAQICVERGALDALLQCITRVPMNVLYNRIPTINTKRFNTTLSSQKTSKKSAITPTRVREVVELQEKVYESATSALGAIASHSKGLASAVAQPEIIKELIRSCKFLVTAEAAISALGNIGKHSEELSQLLIENNAIETIIEQIRLDTHNSNVIKVSFIALGNFCAQHPEAGRIIMQNGMLPFIAERLVDSNSSICKASATLSLQLVRHDAEVASEFVTSGGHEALVEYLKNYPNDPIDAITSLGVIASISADMAASLIEVGANSLLLTYFSQTPWKTASAWAIGQIGMHSPDHALSLTELNALSLLLSALTDPSSSNDLKEESKGAMKLIMKQTFVIEPLIPLVVSLPVDIAYLTLKQCFEVLKIGSKNRAKFVASGAYFAMQKMKFGQSMSQKILNMIDKISSLFPDSVVETHSPEFPTELMKAIEKY